jgi:hypothetical protein
MSCDEVRVALPILPDGDADEAARIRAHCAACAPCGEWLAGHESDASLLAAVRAGRDAAPPPAALNGFTASVLARVAAEREAAPRSGTLLAWPGALRAAAAAAAVLLGVAVGLRGGSQTSAPVAGTGEVVASRDPVVTAPTPVATVPVATAPAPRDPVATAPAPTVAETPGDALAAPIRDRAPTPPRRRARPAAGSRDVVPVGGTGGRQVLPQGMLPGGLFEDLERILPELQRRMERRQAGDGVREVKF